MALWDSSVMPVGDSVARLRQYTAAAQVSPVLRRQLVDCWVTVTNAGGAVGFPFPPVDEATVAPAADDLIARLDPDLRRLLVAVRSGIACCASASNDVFIV